MHYLGVVLDCYSSTVSDYDGHQQTTASGKQCLRWDQLIMANPLIFPMPQFTTQLTFVVVLIITNSGASYQNLTIGKIAVLVNVVSKVLERFDECDSELYNVISFQKHFLNHFMK